MARLFVSLAIILLVLAGVLVVSADPPGSWLPSARGTDASLDPGISPAPADTLPSEMIIYIGRSSPVNKTIPDVQQKDLSAQSITEPEPQEISPMNTPVADGILVRYSDDAGAMSASSVSIDSAIGAVSVEDYSAYGIDGLQKVIPPENMTEGEAVAYYENQPGVLYAEPNYIWSQASVPNDPGLPNQWGLINSGQIYREGYPAGLAGSDIDASAAWDISTSAGDVIIAVIDSGADYTHPDLIGNIWTDDAGNHGYDVLNDDPDPSDDNGHGTRCVGIIGAVGNNGIGVSGVAWQARIMPVKALDASGNAKVSDIIKAIGWATSHGATVISCSFGSPSYSQAAYDAMSSSSALFVCAAGNSDQNNDITPFYPASYGLDNVISVSASDARDTLAMKSNYGASSVHIAAPGSSIYSTQPMTLAGSNGYAYDSGTSMATPFVSASAAVIKAQAPALSNREIRDLLVRTADPVPALQGKNQANGRLNLATALRSLSPGEKIPLFQGWNFLSVPCQLSPGSDTAGSLFSGVPSGGHSILTYTPVDGWRTVGAQTRIEPLTGYWIFSEQQMEIPVTCSQGQVSKQVSAGWNTFGIASDTPQTAKDALQSVQSIWTYLVMFNPGTQQYETVIIRGSDDGRQVTPYQAGWLYCTDSGTLTG